MKFSYQKYKILFIVLFTIVFIPSCGVWDNFTTYFNLYYNTSELFDKAEKQIKSQKKELFSTTPNNVTGSTKADLIKVIEKCSDLLQFNSQSSYVDDALMILGKSFYYQRNYQKAIRKFKELITNYPESDDLLEANLWIGKCQMRLKKYDEGLRTLTGVRTEASENGEDEIIRESYVEEIVYKITIDDINGAIEVANEFMDVSNDDEIKAEVWFEIGRLNMQVENVESAITAFENVFEYSPDFDLQFEARLNYGKALRKAGRSSEALNVFNDMKSEDKYSDKYGDIDFEIAKTNRKLGNIETAINLFNDVDTTYKSSPVSGASKYEIGSIYETDLINFDSAATYYSKASASTLPKEYIELARDKNRLFSKYVKLDKSIKKYDKQLFYAENPDVFVKDSIAYVEDSLAIAEEIANIQELQAIWSGLDSLLVQQDTTGYYADTLKSIDSLITKDSTLIRDTLLAKLKNPQPEDSNFVAQFDSVFNSPAFVQAREGTSNAFNQQLLEQNRQLTNELPDTLKFKNNPPQRPKIPQDSLRSLLAKNQLQMGNLLLTELNRPDSARWYYYNILTKYPDTRYEANTLYALGSYYLTIDDEQHADSLFNIIYNNYQSESIVNAAADKLNKPFIDLNYDPAKDDYEDAEYIMLNENYSDAIDQFYDIYRTYPNSPYAAKSLYACGWILEYSLSMPDSAVSFYDSLVSKYPTSVYVGKIASKLSIYKQEKRKLELAHKDSLNALNFTEADSLTNDSLNQYVNPLIPVENDTTQVALQNEDKTEKPEEKSKSVNEQNQTVLPKIKEPLWNPRKRKY